MRKSWQWKPRFKEGVDVGYVADFLYIGYSVWEVQGMVWVLGYGLNVRLASGLRPGDSEVMSIRLFHMFVFHSVSLHTCSFIVLFLLSGRSVGRQVLFEGSRVHEHAFVGLRQH